jgi:hypothetical protein
MIPLLELKYELHSWRGRLLQPCYYIHIYI